MTAARTNATRELVQTDRTYGSSDTNMSASAEMNHHRRQRNSTKLKKMLTLHNNIHNIYIYIETTTKAAVPL